MKLWYAQCLFIKLHNTVYVLAWRSSSDNNHRVDVYIGFWSGVICPWFKLGQLLYNNLEMAWYSWTWIGSKTLCYSPIFQTYWIQSPFVKPQYSSDPMMPINVYIGLLAAAHFYLQKPEMPSFAIVPLIVHFNRFFISETPSYSITVAGFLSIAVLPLINLAG